MRKNNSVPSINEVDIRPLIPSPAYQTYWRFAAKRQDVFFRRASGELPPWTSDSILLEYKFTNAYRASDRVSQYLIRHVIYRDDLPTSDDEVFFRILLFKLFNRIETWELLEREFGDIKYENYSFENYDQVLTAAMESKQKIYSAAYIMPSAGSLGHRRKHRNHLVLLERMMTDCLPEQLAASESMQQAFELIRSYPSIGDFLAYQFVTDVNYSMITQFSEMEFVVAGPGAVNGIRKCFVDRAGLSDKEIIKFMADRQELEFKRLGVEFQSLWGRPLQLIDCQNLFCEVDKYSRVYHPELVGKTHRTRIKQKFSPTNEPINYFFPPKWKIVPTLPLSLTNSCELQMISLKDYQVRSNDTDQVGSTDPNATLIPILGLAGEAGELLNEYKKYLRDGDEISVYLPRLQEELGDMLWYIANVATKLNLDLGEVAENNLKKCENRFASTGDATVFDAAFPEGERLPRLFQIDFNTVHDKDGTPTLKAYFEGNEFGDKLTDNSVEPDGYRFHDVFHLSFASVLGWSPATRTLLKRKRKSVPETDEVEDGGRAQAIEEGISAMIFGYAKRYDFLEGKTSVSSELLRTIKCMTEHLEVARCTTGEWEKAIIQGFDIWREIKRRGGGTLIIDLDERHIQIKEH